VIKSPVSWPAVGSPAGCEASARSAPCRNSSSASRFSPAHSRNFGFAIDHENFKSSGYAPSPHTNPRTGVSFSHARRLNVKAFSSSGTLKARNSATSNGSPMSGSPFRHVSHHMARAVAVTATQAARTTTTRSSWRSRLRSNWSSFGDVPLAAAEAGAGLSA
jgi:hypothetical protein